MSPGSAELRVGRRATAVRFAVHGCVSGSFAARVPWIASHAHLSVGELGLALLMPGIGALVAMPVSGGLAHHHSSRWLITTTLVGWCCLLVLPPLATSLVSLCGSLLVFGAAAGLADMAINAQGVLIERHVGRSVMSGFHGLWSVGLLSGSAVSALASHLGIDARLQFPVVAVVLASVAAIAGRWLLDDAREGGQAPPRFALPTKPVLLIGLVGLCAVFGEQAGIDWSALFIRRELGGSPSAAALAVSGFAGTMAIVRLFGDRLIRFVGPVRVIEISGIWAAAGVLAIILAPGLALGFGGFALLGAGVALVVPLVFAAAGRIGAHPARSIAGVAGIAYGSGLITPGVIGGIAAATSLKMSFAVVGCLAVAMSLAAGLLRPAHA